MVLEAAVNTDMMDQRARAHRVIGRSWSGPVIALRCMQRKGGNMEIAFTERELDIMGVLWDRGSATVAEVREDLSDDLAYTTVLTMLRVLEEKGHVSHEEEGRAHRYYPLVERDKAGKSAVRRLTRKLFQGSRELLLTQLVSDRDLSEEELRRMRKLLDERIKEVDR